MRLITGDLPIAPPLLSPSPVFLRRALSVSREARLSNQTRGAAGLMCVVSVFHRRAARLPWTAS